MTAKPEDDPDEAAELAQRLPLLDALIRWVDPKLTEGVRQCEQRHTKRELLTYDKPVLSKPNELRVPTNTSWMAGPSDLSALSAAWRAAIRSFKRQVQDGELHLEGVEFTDDLSTQPQAIPGTFAAQMNFNFFESTLKLAKRQFLSVTASRKRSAWAPIGVPAAIPPSAATQPLTISALTDEQILELLNEHVRRVIESPDPKMMARIKDVLQPILIRRLEWRSKASSLLPTLAGEAREIQAWITQVATWHPRPSQKTVENNIRETYWRLNPRSRPPLS